MFHAGSFVFAFIAGVLSLLSPCILPILPIALGGATSAHRLGPLALAAGLAVSFTAIGLFVATLGISLGLGNATFQFFGATLLVLMGGFLLAPALQARFATAAGPVSNWIEARFGGLSVSGLRGQFGLGLLFGAIWSPCAGPTLGAAALMAATGHDLEQSSLVMFAFGIGASFPLLMLGLLSRATFQRWRSKITGGGTLGKAALGTTLVVFGVLILTGSDQSIQTWLVLHSPDWLIHLTTQY